MSQPIRYFAYGSNLHPLRLAVRAPEHRVDGIAHLAGYRVAFHKRSRIDGSGKCNILETGDSRDRVFGVVYEIDEAGLGALDNDESVHGGYGRVAVDVITGRGGATGVWTYQAPQRLIDESLAPYDWYHRLVVRGARHHGLPGHYIRELENVVAHYDCDTQRRRPFDRILEQL